MSKKLVDVFVNGALKASYEIARDGAGRNADYEAEAAKRARIDGVYQPGDVQLVAKVRPAEAKAARRAA